MSCYAKAIKKIKQSLEQGKSFMFPIIKNQVLVTLIATKDHNQKTSSPDFLKARSIVLTEQELTDNG
ncbi:hypothetical protein BWI75_09180 [Gloeocapsopsis sp. AAB1 = 1H9]|uniref:Uncharacterized protein n=1 Tax=Gloeocapsopsis dulcis AAB1 = 1H9 TaxID=1433147 RepID=A0A6N8FWJ3_9CHRO|nr:hypothetical protein [Gloeocapsopsis dulcis AAB1 = 1H9]